MQPLLIDHDDALDFGLHALLELDPKLKPLLALSGRPPLRKRAPGFPGLAGIIVSQQVSTESAASIWARITGEFPALAPAHILESNDARLKALGLSAPKIRTLRATADAVVSGALPLDTLHRALDGRYLSSLLFGTFGCVSGGRSRAAGSGTGRVSDAGTTGCSEARKAGAALATVSGGRREAALGLLRSDESGA